MGTNLSDKPVKGYTGLYTYGVNHDHYRIKKSVKGIKLHERFGLIPEEEAIQRYLSMVNAARNGRMYQTRPSYTIAQLAHLYMQDESKHKLRTWNEIVRDINRIIIPEFGQIIGAQLNSAHTRAFIARWKANGKKPATINNQLANLGRIITWAYEDAIDPVTQLSYLAHPVKIARVQREDFTPEEEALIQAGKMVGFEKESYRLTQTDEIKFLGLLLPEYRTAAEFILYTGIRTKNLINLRWDQEEFVDELEETVFKIPGSMMKNKRPWILVLNSKARNILEAQRGRHPEYVFTNCHNEKWSQLYTNTWQKAWAGAGFPADNPNILKGPHNLRHTFGERLRAAGVSEMDQDDLLAHYKDGITRRYAAPQLIKLREASELVIQKIKLKLA